MKECIVLLSGGIDSTTVMAIARQGGYNINSISFDYGQKNKYELKSAQEVAKMFDAKRHLVIKVDLDKIGGSALTDDIEVPKYRGINDNKIPVTYVPARNIIFLSYALAWAEVIHSEDIFFGANVVDYSGYPDCRPEFIKAFEGVANLGTRQGSEGKRIKIHTPVINLSKGEIIKKGMELNVDYSMTVSCYNPQEDGISCGVCDSCMLRKKGFEEAGIRDPIKYNE